MTPPSDRQAAGASAHDDDELHRGDGDRSGSSRPGLLIRRDVLIELLDAAGISERELARRAGLGHATVNHLVTTRRKYCSEATAVALCRALNVERHTLFIELGD